MEYEKPLSAQGTGIEGLMLLDLAVHGDSRGWFKENWQRAKMAKLGIPDLHVVQNNISFNAARGVTRGIHAEPWNKFVSIAHGSVFGAWVDLREGSATFGKVFTATLDPSKAIFVPRGVGNSFQALEDGTTYTYLVDAHWSAELKETYTFVNLTDPKLGIEWPIPLSECELSEADRNHPMIADVAPMAPKKTLVTGCNGQLGRAIRREVAVRDLKGFVFTDIDEFNFADSNAYAAINWDLYGTVINCGAFTAVDAAETNEGRVACWRANATGPALLAQICAEHGITLVHISSDYVFDGTRELHNEEEPLSPLGVYGQSKAAGDIAIRSCPSHYILRSSWVIGDGRNFVKTMAMLSDRCSDPSDSLSTITVVNDQFGRLSFTDEMAHAIFYLLDSRPPYGTYNMTGSGRTVSWYEIAWHVFELRNGNGSAVHPISTVEYYASAKNPVSPRPTYSSLDLSKLEAVGFSPRDWEKELAEYVESIPAKEV